MIASFERCDEVDMSPNPHIETGAFWRAELEVVLQRWARERYGVPIQDKGTPVILHGSYVHASGRRGSINQFYTDGK